MKIQLASSRFDYVEFVEFQTMEEQEDLISWLEAKKPGHFFDRGTPRQNTCSQYHVAAIMCSSGPTCSCHDLYVKLGDYVVYRNGELESMTENRFNATYEVDSE